MRTPGVLRTVKQVAMLRKIRSHKKDAILNSEPRNKNQTSYMVRKFLEFQRQSGSKDPKIGDADTYAIIL